MCVDNGPHSSRTCSKFTDSIVVGKTMAFTSIQFKNSQGEVFARGSHTKFIALAWKDPKNITEELKPKKEE
jgi:acyl-coenzyme A thioesterase 13